VPLGKPTKRRLIKSLLSYIVTYYHHIILVIYPILYRYMMNFLVISYLKSLYDELLSPFKGKFVTSRTSMIAQYIIHRTNTDKSKDFANDTFLYLRHYSTHFSPYQDEQQPRRPLMRRYGARITLRVNSNTIIVKKKKRTSGSPLLIFQPRE